MVFIDFGSFIKWYLYSNVMTNGQTSQGLALISNVPSQLI